MISFKNKSVLITGAGSGLGRNVAMELSKLEAKLVLLDINATSLEETKSLCYDGCEIKMVIADLRDMDNCIRLLDSICADLKLNAFVHCAGVASICPLKSLKREKYLNVMQINTFAGLEIAKWFSHKKHHADDDANICFIASVYGLVGSAANVAYAISKGAVIAMTKALSIELAPKKIRVNAIAPGFFTGTNMGNSFNNFFDDERQELVNSLHPLGLGKASDVAKSVVFMISDASKWTTGAVFSVDGGFSAQ